MQYNKSGPQFTLPVGNEDLSELTMLVEIPKGSINKYEYKVETGMIHLDRVMFQQTPYPVEYGLIPRTWDEDNDMLDIMSLVSHHTFPGCIMMVRPIGVMVFEDSGEVDDKIIGVPAEDIRYAHIRNLSELPQHTLDEITFFFERYKTIQAKYKGKELKTVVKHWGDEAKAREILHKAIARFNEKFPEQK